MRIVVVGCLVAMILPLGQFGDTASGSSPSSVSSHPTHRIWLLDGLCLPPGHARAIDSTWSVPPGWTMKGLERSGLTTDTEASAWCPPGLAKKSLEWIPPGQAKKHHDDATTGSGATGESKPTTGNGWIPPKGPIGDY